MSDITLSPIPYNSGSLAGSTPAHHYCDMGGGVFLNVAYQVSPNYLYAWVSTNTNIKTGTFSSTNSPMRALLSSGTTPAAPTSNGTGIRVWKLNSNSAIMLMGSSLYVLQITATNDVVIKAGTLAGQNSYNISTYSSNVFNYGGASNAGGAVFQGWYVRDNVFYYVARSSNSTYQYTLYKAVYDPNADTLTRTALTTQTVGGTNSAIFAQYNLVSIPGSTKKLFWERRGANVSMAAMTPGYAVLIDSVTDTLGTAIPANPNTSVLCALSETTVLGFNAGSSSYLTWNGTAWNTTPAVFAANNMAGTQWNVEALDSNYFAIFNYYSTNIDISGGTALAYARIGRFVDASFGQVSSASAGSGGISITLPQIVFPDFPLFTRVGTDAFYSYGCTSAAFTPQIRVVYQPGA